MADIKYLVTVNSETGTPTKFELVGDAGELTELDLRELSWDCGSAGGTGGISVVINISGGTGVNPQGGVKVTESGKTLWSFPSPIPRPPSPPRPGR